MKELQDQLAILVGKIRDEDIDDPEVQVLMEQLQATLHPVPEKLSQEMIDQLSQILDKRERFKQAAIILGLQTPPELRDLAEALKMAGLMA